MVKYEISKREIAQIFGISYVGEEKKYVGVCTIDNPQNQSIIFIKKITQEKASAISHLEGCLIITQEETELDNDTIIVENTRLAMAKVLNFISSKLSLDETSVSNSAFIHTGAKIGDNVRIEAFAYIDDKVEIGNGVMIKQGAKILRNTVIGDYSVIRENSVVGGQGFGVEKDKHGNNLKISHLGGVKIGKHVEVGALNTIVSGTINPTTIEDYTKIDDHVHIAHNCRIGKNAIITAGVILSGSVSIGSNVWVGPNSTIKNSITVNDDNLIGIGTVITKDIKDGEKTYAGVPGKEFGDFIKDKKAMHFLVNNLEKIKKAINDIE
jgi:UDP-3-O-[3-hydroxymyristoyl] glucosamine N-acyltransferase